MTWLDWDARQSHGRQNRKGLGEPTHAFEVCSREILGRVSIGGQHCPPTLQADAAKEPLPRWRWVLADGATWWAQVPAASGPNATVLTIIFDPFMDIQRIPTPEKNMAFKTNWCKEDGGRLSYCWPA